MIHWIRSGIHDRCLVRCCNTSIRRRTGPNAILAPEVHAGGLQNCGATQCLSSEAGALSNRQQRRHSGQPSDVESPFAARSKCSSLTCR